MTICLRFRQVHHSSSIRRLRCYLLKKYYMEFSLQICLIYMNEMLANHWRRMKEQQEQRSSNSSLNSIWMPALFTERPTASLLFCTDYTLKRLEVFIWWTVVNVIVTITISGSIIQNRSIPLSWTGFAAY